MTTALHHFTEFDRAVRDLYDQIPLDDIESLTFDEKNPVTFFSDVLRLKQNLKPFPYSDFKIYDELLFMSRDIKYYTALLYFFRPYITNSLNGIYYQTREGYQLASVVGGRNTEYRHNAKPSNIATHL